MNKSIMAIIMSIVSGFCVFAEQKEAVSPSGEICSEVFCREAKTISLKDEEGNVFDLVLEAPSPVIVDGMVMLFPGDRVYVEAEIKKKKLVNLKAVSEITDPSRTLVFDFSQKEMGGISNMVLNVKNPFEMVIKYHADMSMPGKEGFYQTSSCPVLPKIQGFEMWPHPIVQMFISDLRVYNDKASKKLSCEY